MSNFSKFFHSQEELILTAASRPKSFGLYFTLTLLCLAFFMLIPVWKIGRQGFSLWLGLVLILLFVLAQQLTRSQNLYLITNQRIIYLQAKGHEEYIFRGALHLQNMQSLSKHSFSNICLKTEQGKYYLWHLAQRDLVYDKISKLIT